MKLSTVGFEALNGGVGLDYAGEGLRGLSINRKFPRPTLMLSSCSETQNETSRHFMITPSFDRAWMESIGLEEVMGIGSKPLSTRVPSLGVVLEPRGSYH